MKLLYRILCIAAAILVCSCSGSNNTDLFENDMQEFRQSLGNVGMSVAVVKDNKIIYTNSFGLSNIETEEPTTDESLYRIASISKSFTATSIMQLVEKGIVSLDMDASSLAGFPIRNPRYPDTVITLEMMMSHTSSINDSQGYFNFNGINPETNPDYANAYNDYEPGTGYEYCNLNYNLIGSFLEKLSGERFDQYVVNHVLRPLDLYGGYCVDSLDSKRFAHIYEWSSSAAQLKDRSDDAYDPKSEAIKNYIPTKQTALFSPTGGMKISAPDLAKYMMMHMNYGTSPSGVKIISEENSKSMQTPRSSDENYGLALKINDGDYLPGIQLVGHTGGAYGLRSAMFFSPEDKYGFVMISNGCEKTTNESGEDVINGSIRRMYKYFIQGK